MEFQAEIVQVTEDLHGDLPRGSCHHPGEHDLAQLGEQRDADARRPVRQQQADRKEQQRPLDVEPVDDLLQHQRHEEGGDFGDQDQPERQDDPAEIGAQVGKERADHGEIAVPAAGGPGKGGAVGLFGGGSRHGLRADR